MPTRPAVVALVLVALALVAAACTSSPSSTSPSTTATTAARTTTSTTSASTTSTAGGTSTTTVQVASCTFSQLAVSAGQSAAGLGHIGVPLVFHNSGPAACSLYGYPGVAALDAQGNQAAQAQRTLNGYLGGLPPGSAKPTVILQPGQAASAMVEGTDNPIGTETSCPQYPALLVTPPNTTQSVRVTAALPGCSAIEVHPVVPGVTGSPE